MDSSLEVVLIDKACNPYARSPVQHTYMYVSAYLIDKLNETYL